ncbi:MAG: hypothetical protein IAE79_07715 [Anaerolinea sp.]|nr:hypothetical protein [Anaerolinea sp.]
MTNRNILTAETFVVAMPNDAAPLGFDPFNDGFTWHDVLPANYWNLDLLEEKAAAMGGNPVVTPARIVIQTVVDPEVPEAQQDKTPKLVMEFVENVPSLVLNKTRCTLATQLTNTPNPAKWVGLLPRLELYAGAYRDMAAALQILFRPVTNGNGNGNGNGRRAAAPAAPVDSVNEDLFG